MSFGEVVGQDSEGQEAVAPQEPTQNSQPEAPPAEQSDGNPVWAPLKDALGDFAYHKATPFLKEWDAAANKRITEVNSKFEPWKQFADQGVTPDMVSQAFMSLQQIQQDPVTFYYRLAETLRAQGLIEEAEQVEAEADALDDSEDPRDRELAQLREQNERIMAWQEAQYQFQEQERLNAEAKDSLSVELTALQRDTRLSDDDLRMVLQRAHLYASAQQDRTLRQVYDEIQAERSAVLSQPRPNDFAPRLPGVGGSAPTGGPAKKPEDFTREETQAYMADLLRKANQAG